MLSALRTMTERVVRAARRAPLVALLVLLATAVAGGVVGVALDRAWLMRGFPGGPGMPMGPLPAPTPMMRKQLTDRVAQELELTDAQRTQFEELFDRRSASMRATGDSVQTLLEKWLTETRAQMAGILTPEQQKKFNAMAPFGGRGGRGGRGGPGGRGLRPPLP
jgi:Spy/CpxP family protein refolding chaperone